MLVSFLRAKHRAIPALVVSVGLGVVVTYIPQLLAGWIFLLVLTAAFELITSGNTNGNIHYFLGYYLGMEILARIAKLSPWVPYESGKYLLFVFLILGILISRKVITNRGSIGLIIILLLIPSFFLLTADIEYKDIVFNSLGIINLALGIIYFSRVYLKASEIPSLLRIIVLGIIPVLVSVILKTPDFDDLKFTLSANFDTSAGFGSNQVSTLLSLGFLILALSLLLSIPLFQQRWITIVLMLLFFFRALLTFSRGGLVGAVIVLVLVWLVAYLSVSYALPKGLTFIRVASGLMVLSAIFFYTNRLTSNTLLLRYQGETETTLAGTREKDISLLTSNRLDIVISDLTIWSQNFMLGIGPGMSKYSRSGLLATGVAAHIEFTRLLAEHGMFGLVICLILLIYPAILVIRERIGLIKLLQLGLFGYALFTMVHSAMRTNVTPYLFALATISILIPSKKIRDKNRLSRQPLAAAGA